jgi:hypothetical protein
MDADEILVIDAGRIVERGSHADLLAARGRYAQMWQLQHEGDRYGASPVRGHGSRQAGVSAGDRSRSRGAAAALFGRGRARRASGCSPDLPPFQLAGLLYLGAALGVAPAARSEAGCDSVRARARSQPLALLGAIARAACAARCCSCSGCGSRARRRSRCGSCSRCGATALLGSALLPRSDRRARRRGCALRARGAVSAHGAGRARAGGTPADSSLAACVCWGLDNHLTALIDGITPSRPRSGRGSARAR